MSAERSPRDGRGQNGDLAKLRPDMTQLHARRRAARRRTRTARIDLGLGLFGAMILLITSPGLAITLLIVTTILLLCGISVFRDRRRSSAAAQEPADPAPGRGAGVGAAGAARQARRGPDRVVRDRTGSTR